MCLNNSTLPDLNYYNTTIPWKYTTEICPTCGTCPTCGRTKAAPYYFTVNTLNTATTPLGTTKVDTQEPVQG